MKTIAVLLVVLGTCSAVQAQAECGLDLSSDVRRFRDDLLELVESEEIYCTSYPIHLFPCLFCECQGEWEFVKEDSAESDNLYQCRPRLESYDPRDEPSEPRELGLLGNIRKNVEKLLNRTQEVDMVPETSGVFLVQDVDVDTELEGGPNSIKFLQEIRADDDFTEKGDGYNLKVNADAGAGYGVELGKDDGVWRAAIVAGGSAEQDARFRVGPGV